MTLKNTLSLILFIMFIISFISKLYIQSRKDGIKAFVMGKGHKPRETRIVEVFVRVSSFIWGTTWVVESLFDKWISNTLGLIFTFKYFNYFGLFIISVGLTIFLKAMFDMKSSWRVGIDKETKTKLIINGIYKFSRNPAFVGFDLMFIGLFVTYSNLLVLIVTLVNIISFHFLILQEEKHLETVFGSDYITYMQTTPRYFGF